MRNPWNKLINFPFNFEYCDPEILVAVVNRRPELFLLGGRCISGRKGRVFVSKQDTGKVCNLIFCLCRQKTSSDWRVKRPAVHVLRNELILRHPRNSSRPRMWQPDDCQGFFSLPVYLRVQFRRLTITFTVIHSLRSRPSQLRPSECHLQAVPS